MTEDETLADLLASMKRTRRNRIVVCLHETSAKNYMQAFKRMVQQDGLPFEIISETAVEVRVNLQWQRVYFASAFQDPIHYAGRAAEVHLMPGIHGAMMAWSWERFAEQTNKQWEMTK